LWRSSGISVEARDGPCRSAQGDDADRDDCDRAEIEAECCLAEGGGPTGIGGEVKFTTVETLEILRS